MGVDVVRPHETETPSEENETIFNYWKWNNPVSLLWCRPMIFFFRHMVKLYVRKYHSYFAIRNFAGGRLAHVLRSTNRTAVICHVRCIKYEQILFGQSWEDMVAPHTEYRVQSTEY